MYQLKTIKCTRKYEIGIILRVRKEHNTESAQAAQLWMSCAPAFAADLCRPESCSGTRRCRQQKMHLAVTPLDVP